jgi:hypothetical protein
MVVEFEYEKAIAFDHQQVASTTYGSVAARAHGFSQVLEGSE